MNLAYSCQDIPTTKCYTYTALPLFLPRAPRALGHCFERIYFSGVFGNLGMMCINRENIQERRQECCHKAGSSFPIQEDIPSKDIELLRKVGLSSF